MTKLVGGRRDPTMTHERALFNPCSGGIEKNTL